jgi:23S rRNA pseudouridine955/2504/2580 synthase
MQKPLVKNSVEYLTIDESYQGQRIDNFLMTKLKGVPKTRIYRILRKGEVRVNKKRIEPSYRLQANDILRIPPVHLPIKDAPLLPSFSLQALLKQRILFEDNSFLIINKPSGIPVHGGSQVKIGIVEALKSMYPEFPQLELVHRLDADTSGCLMLAKKRSVLREMHGLLRTGMINKIYWALTKGHWQPDQYRVDQALFKNQLSSGGRVVKVDPEGKAALTVFKPLEVFADATLVQAKLYTGRTHQIRVHSQFHHHEIAGDEKYGDKDFSKKMQAYGLKRLFLHARLLQFELPSLGQKIKVEAPLDEDLQAVLKCLPKAKSSI